MRRIFLEILIGVQGLIRKKNVFKHRKISLMLIIFVLTGLFISAGCSGISSDDENNTGITSAIIGSIGGIEQNILNGLSAMKTDDLNQAEAEFLKIVNSDTASAYQKSQAQAGVGWINMTKDNFSEARKNFIAGSDQSLDAVAGLAASVASAADSSMDHEVLKAMEKAGFKDINKKIDFSIDHSVTEADLRSLMAYYYALVGDTESAKYQYEKSLALNSGDAMVFAEVLKMLNVIGE
jgi:tetratricopeptide (TPR) repeat protein